MNVNPVKEILIRKNDGVIRKIGNVIVSKSTEGGKIFTKLENPDIGLSIVRERPVSDAYYYIKTNYSNNNGKKLTNMREKTDNGAFIRRWFEESMGYVLELFSVGNKKGYKRPFLRAHSRSSISYLDTVGIANALEAQRNFAVNVPKSKLNPFYRLRGKKYTGQYDNFYFVDRLAGKSAPKHEIDVLTDMVDYGVVNNLRSTVKYHLGN